MNIGHVPLYQKPAFPDISMCINALKTIAEFHLSVTSGAESWNYVFEIKFMMWAMHISFSSLTHHWWTFILYLGPIIFCKYFSFDNRTQTSLKLPVEFFNPLMLHPFYLNLRCITLFHSFVCSFWKGLLVTWWFVRWCTRTKECRLLWICF